MEKFYLWPEPGMPDDASRPSITFMPVADHEIHPAILVIPGGGYGTVCESTEGSPIGRKFNELGYHAFILDYRVAPHRWPEPQLDAMRAMKMIRANSKKWLVDPDDVAVCGFSAGAHLAGSLGILCGGLDASAGDEADRFSHLPSLMILCYGVLSFQPWSHQGTAKNLLGERYPDFAADYSLPEKVTADTPPAFLFHTISDQVVPFANSMEFASAMAAAGRPCELFLGNWGDHGMLLGKDTLDAVKWPELADAFHRSLLLSKTDPEFRQRYTNRYQSRCCSEKELS